VVASSQILPLFHNVDANKSIFLIRKKLFSRFPEIGFEKNGNFWNSSSVVISSVAVDAS